MILNFYCSCFFSKHIILAIFSSLYLIAHQYTEAPVCCMPISWWKACFVLQGKFLEASIDLFFRLLLILFFYFKNLPLRVLILSYMKDWKKGMGLWRKLLESTWNSLEHLGYAHCAWRIGIWVQISMRAGMKNSSRPSPLCRTGKKSWMRYFMPLELIKYFYDLVKLLVGSLVISSLSNKLQYRICMKCIV